jgi:uncharacterized protein YqhQ
MSGKKDKEFLLGGQAVIEGVLMRSPRYYAVAVRRPNGDIAIKRKHQPRLTDRYRWLGLPFIRGIVTLGQTLALGINALNYSAEMASDEHDTGSEDVKKSSSGGWALAITITFAVVFAFGLVVFLPLLLTDLTIHILPALDTPLAFNTIDGLFRVLFFLLYIVLISLMPDIRRVFQYHGAEHMSVHASENEKEISVNNARAYSPYHPRCGTSFLLLVMLVAILVFSLTPHRGNFWIRLLIRTPLVPLIAGVSYEVLRITARLNRKGLFAVLSAPGLWLQRLTAKHPDEKQLEVGVVALNQVLLLEHELDGEPVPAEEEDIIITVEPES